MKKAAVLLLFTFYKILAFPTATYSKQPTKKRNKDKSFVKKQIIIDKEPGTFEFESPVLHRKTERLA